MANPLVTPNDMIAGGAHLCVFGFLQITHKLFSVANQKSLSARLFHNLTRKSNSQCEFSEAIRVSEDGLYSYNQVKCSVDFRCSLEELGLAV